MSELERRLQELAEASWENYAGWDEAARGILLEAARIGAEIEREIANELYEDAMNAIHERAGIKRDGLAALFAWIDDKKEAEREWIHHARDRHDY